MIQVSKPFLPPIDDYEKELKNIWKSSWVTNRGPLVRKLENKLESLLNLKNILFVSNGTIALQLAIKALNLKGEIITTPFTYVATTSSIVWEGCTPIYVDIDPKTLNIDPTKIEAAITDKTSAIIATHVYGNPCDVIAIEKIAKKYKLKVIYDAAHAFGVEVEGKSIFNYGDLSTCSTHATKLFHTIEGGFVVTSDELLRAKIKFMHNFGHDGPEAYHGLGINGKNSEFHAAMGLTNLKYVETIHEKRKNISKYYDLKLKNFNAVKPLWHKNSFSNYAYYPLVFENEKFLLKSIKLLEEKNIFGRRYFYPSLSTCLPYIKTKTFKNVDSISKRVFCLPLYFELTFEDVDLICSILTK